MTALVLNAVTKRFGPHEAVSAVGTSVARGECVALLGHNGAGKTTLIRLVLGLTATDSGRIDVLGHAPGSALARRATTYMPESIAFHPLLTGREQLRIFARLKGEDARTADAMLERVDLDRDADRRIGTYSKGMRQKVGLAQAFIGEPGLLLLDEPTSGLDPVARWSFYGMVREATERGAAVVLSSHALTEVESQTDRIVMLRKGRLVADGNLKALRDEAALPTCVRIAARSGDADALHAVFGGRRVNGRSIELMCLDSEKIELIANVTARADLVDDVEVHAPSLDDLYRHYSHEEA